MLSRGLFLAVNAAELKALRAAKGDPARRAVAADMEEEWPRACTQDTDKAWRFLYECLFDEGCLKTLFRYGTSLHRAEFCVINLVPAAKVPQVNTDLSALTKARLRELYDRLNPDYYAPGEFEPSTAHFDYVWTWFKAIREWFSQLPAGDGAVFTADWD